MRPETHVSRSFAFISAAYSEKIGNLNTGKRNNVLLVHNKRPYILKATSDIFTKAKPKDIKKLFNITTILN